MPAQPIGTAVIRATWAEVRLALAQTNIQSGLCGPRGVGKTHGAMLCRIKSPNKKLSRITHKVQAHAELSPAEILGMYVPVDNGFAWMDGPVATCYAKGGLLVIDEIVEASGPVKTFLHGALDRGPGGTISYAGRIFEQSPGYQVAATMNGWPDQGGLPRALLDRFDAWFVITQPSEEQLLVLEPDLRDICRDCYDPEVVEDEMEGPDITFRMLLGLQKLRKIMPIEMAVLSACYGNKTLAQSLYEIIQLADPEEEEVAGVVAAPHDPSTMTAYEAEQAATHEYRAAIEREYEIAGLDDEADEDDDDEEWDDE